MKKTTALLAYLSLLSMLSTSSAQIEEINEIMNAPSNFPIITSDLSPKEFDTYINQIGEKGGSVSNSLCIIGHDELSVAWLNQKKEQLIEANVFCFVVNVKTRADFDQLQSIAPKLKMSAISANWLNKYLKIEHYPALITNEYIAQ